MHRGEKLDLEIGGMSHGSYAIARTDTVPVFVDNVCPGDKITAEVYDLRPRFAFAHVIDINENSEYREIEPKCKLHKVCGGCQWQHIKYEQQLEYKRKNVIDLMVNSKIIDPSWRENYYQDDELIKPAIGMNDKPWNYRNKVVYPVGTKSTGRLVAGYYKKNTHDLINIKHCPIQYELFDEIMAEAKECLSDLHVQKPPLRHIALRANHDQSQVLLTFIARSEWEAKHPKKNLASFRQKLSKAAQHLLTKFSQIKGVAVNFNDQSTNVIWSHKTETLIGEPYIIDEINGVKFRISPTSFFQINNLQAAKLIETVSDFAELNADARVLDAYAGTGTFALSLAAKSQAKVTAVEIVESAVNDGKENCKLNDIDTVDFRLGKVEDHVKEFKNGDFDLSIINPPRRGSTNEVLDALGEIAANKIIYVSCNPATLARDIKYLEQYGYKLNKLQPVDLFPHTFHIESVALLTQSHSS